MLTIQRLTPTVDSVISWGDGETTNVPAAHAAVITHNYAGAGVWAVRVTNPTQITHLDLRDTKLSCAAGTIGALTALTFLGLTNVAGITVGAGEIGGLSLLTTLLLSNVAAVTVGAGEIGGLSLLTYLYLYFSAGVTVGAGEIAGLTALVYLILDLVAGVSVGADDIAGLSDLDYMYLIGVAGAALPSSVPAKLTTFTWQNSLSQANVDTLLLRLYTAFLTRTAINGTIDVSGTNAAPSGVFQAAAACPVDGATPGKEIAHELLNDTCATGGNVWATVTTTA